MIPRKQSKDYHALARERGFQWLGPSVRNNKTNTKWYCSQGHTWEARYHDIRKGNGCPHCSKRVPKTEADYHTLAAERRFKWIARGLPRSVNHATKWQCPEGHQWKASYTSIRYNTGCPHCSGRARKMADDYYVLAQSREFRWIGSKLPKNTTHKTKWMCPQGHQWRATYSSVRQGRGCPKCRQERRKKKE
jgi:hypothetical protein